MLICAEITSVMNNMQANRDVSGGFLAFYQIFYRISIVHRVMYCRPIHRV